MFGINGQCNVPSGPEDPILREPTARRTSRRFTVFSQLKLFGENKRAFLARMGGGGTPLPPRSRRVSGSPVTPVSTQCSHIVLARGAPPFCFLLRAREAMAAGGWHRPLFVCAAASFDSSVGIRNAAGTLESFLTAAEWKRPPFVLPPPRQTNKHAMDTKTPGERARGGAAPPPAARRQKLHVFTQTPFSCLWGF